jgi:hypothetical protein
MNLSGKNIARLRHRLGWSQEELQKKLANSSLKIFISRSTQNASLGIRLRVQLAVVVDKSKPPGLVLR